jgi:hypothetical protein
VAQVLVGPRRPPALLDVPHQHARQTDVCLHGRLRDMSRGPSLRADVISRQLRLQAATHPQTRQPPEAAALSARVITGGEAPSGYAPFVLDPTAGDGALMAAWPRERRFGVEIDPDQAEARDYTALRGWSGSTR